MDYTHDFYVFSYLFIVLYILSIYVCVFKAENVPCRSIINMSCQSTTEHVHMELGL